MKDLIALGIDIDSVSDDEPDSKVNDCLETANKNKAQNLEDDDETRVMKPSENPKISQIKRETDISNIIHNIKRDFGDYYPETLLEQFTANFPSTEEISNYLNCDVSIVENELNPLKKYLKRCKINNLEEPTTFKIYYGWANKISGKNIMKKNIAEQLTENGVRIETENAAFTQKLESDLYLPDRLMIIYIIYDEFDLKNLETILKDQYHMKPKQEIIIICYIGGE